MKWTTNVVWRLHTSSSCYNHVWKHYKKMGGGGTRQLMKWLRFSLSPIFQRIGASHAQRNLRVSWISLQSEPILIWLISTLLGAERELIRVSVLCDTELPVSASVYINLSGRAIQEWSSLLPLLSAFAFLLMQEETDCCGVNSNWICPHIHPPPPPPPPQLCYYI